MGLSLAAPAMIAGLILLGVPIAAHLTGHKELREVHFPTLRFLRASELKVRRRTRLEAWMVLLLRCLAVAALVGLFARPSFTWTATSLAGLDPGVPTLILLDGSASMTIEHEGSTIFEAAVTEAGRLLDGLGPGTMAGVLRFDGATTLLEPGLTADHAPLRRALERLEPGHGATDLDRALRRGRQAIDDAGLGRANILVLSDGTASALPAGLKERWPEGVVVHYHDLLGARIANRWVDSASSSTSLRRGEQRSKVSAGM